MRAASLMLAFAAAKAAILIGHPIQASWWLPLALLWQDAAAALLFAALDCCLSKHTRIAWTLYAAAALYAAINIPVERAVGTPLTLPMLRAARGPLADSFRYYMSWQNAALFVGVLAVAALAPRLFRHVRPKPVIAALMIITALGPVASSRVDAFGLDRSAWAALAATSIPRILPWRSPTGDWQTVGFDHTQHGGLEQFAGVAAGRNIVLVSLESTAAQYLGLYGANPDVAPNLTRLAESGIVFDNAYSAYPESIKGLFSILCSMYPALDTSPEVYAAAPCRSLPAVLSASGYTTALFHSGRFAYLGMEDVIRNRGFDVMQDAGDIGGNHESSFGVDEPSTVARILNWVDRLPRGRRFFVAYLPIAGHHPYETLERGPYPDRDLFGRYRNALHYGDESLGTLMEGLRTRGLEDRTLWIVLGDHGEAFGQHEGNSGHTFQVYEENVHVPLVVAMPGVVARQVRSSKVVSLIDVAPTALALAGLPQPANYQGRSVLDSEPRMALFFADYSLGLLGLRDGQRKFIYEMDSGRSRLFNLASDPREQSDLSTAFPAESRWYAENLRNWSAAQKRLLTAPAKKTK